MAQFVPALVFIYWAFNRIVSILEIFGSKIVNELISYHAIGAFVYSIEAVIVIISLFFLNKKVILFFICVAFVICFSFFRSENIPYLLNIIMEIIFGIIPLACLHLLEGDAKKMLKSMHFASYFVVIEIIIEKIFSEKSNIIIENNYMSFVYTAIVPWCIFVYFTFKNRKAIDIIISITSFLVFTVYGSRGGVLVMVIFIVACVLIFNDTKIKTRKIVFIIISFIVVFGITNTGRLIDYANRFILNNEKQNRNLLLFAENRFLYLDNRMLLYNNAIEHIINNPFGFGIGYDRALMNDPGLYVHNIFLELWISIGIILGSIVIYYLVKISFHMIFKCKDEEYRVLFSVYAIPGLIIGMFSGSIYTNYIYYIMIIIYILYYSKNKLYASK